jgi:xanthine dehydrogenase accessory factor
MSATAKMLVTASGARFGTVGGGCLEAEIIERALGVLRDRRPAVSEHTLNSELAGDYGLTCGGTATIFIEPVFADPVLMAVYDACCALLARGERGVLVTALSWQDGVAKALLAGDGVVGQLDPTLIARGRMRGSRVEESALEGDALIEQVAGAPRLVVFGGGHVGAKVAEAATFAGWRVTIVDDRPDFADAARFPYAERAVTCEFQALPDSLGIDSETYVVVATRGHQHDAIIVEQLVRRDLRYIGMLGSRRKVALTARLLEQWGVAGDRVARLHAPVGLEIGADTPSEIAISVVAEMILVRRSARRRQPLTDGAAVREATQNGTQSAAHNSQRA